MTKNWMGRKLNIWNTPKKVSMKKNQIEIPNKNNPFLSVRHENRLKKWISPLKLMHTDGQ